MQKESNRGRLNGTYKVLGWIIDTEANHHLTGSLELMIDVNEVLAHLVGLADGKEAIAEKEGTVVLNEHLKLNNILYVPNLKCNLISMSQLVEKSNCIVQVTNKICVTQDHNTRKLIGTGELREELY